MPEARRLYVHSVVGMPNNVKCTILENVPASTEELVFRPTSVELVGYEGGKELQRFRRR